MRRAQQIWVGQLVDLGGRNTLSYYRDVKVGVLDLGSGSGTNEVAVDQLLGSHAVALASLFAAVPSRRHQVRVGRARP
ncbi:MAG: hypothetical protein ACYCV5_13595 [Acidimicrobiales bacterium]|jgi:hypothetical protein